MQKTIVTPTRSQIATAALVLLLVGGAAIAFSPIFVRLSELGPVATAFWRMALALPAFWLWAAWPVSGSSPAPSAWGPYRWLGLAGIFFAGDLIAWHWALEFTTVSNSTILANCAPILVTLGAWSLFGQRVTATFITGLVMALAGATLLVGAGLSVSSQTWVGDLLSLLTACCYAGYILSVKQARANFSTSAMMAGAGTVACLILLPATLLWREPLLALSWSGWAVLLGLALICQVGGQSLIAYALAHLPAHFSSVTLLVQPALATFFAWLILGERVGSWQAVGGLIVLGGIFMARLGADS